MAQTLVEAATGTVTYDRKRLEDSRLTKKVILAMPAKLTALPGEVMFYYEGFSKLLHLRMQGGEATLRVLKMLGFAGFKVAAVSFQESCYAGDGKVMIGDVEVTATVYDVDTPAKCHLEPYQEEVTKFKMVCEDESSDGVVLG